MLCSKQFFLWVIDWEVQVHNFCGGFVERVVVEMGIGERVGGNFKDEDGDGLKGLVCGSEEGGGVRRFGGGELVSEAFEDGHLIH